jgi:hypothetical protein
LQTRSTIAQFRAFRPIALSVGKFPVRMIYAVAPDNTTDPTCTTLDTDNQTHLENCEFGFKLPNFKITQLQNSS